MSFQNTAFFNLSHSIYGKSAFLLTVDHVWLEWTVANAVGVFYFEPGVSVMMFSHLPLLLGYLDPGTGAIVLQVIAAAVLSAGVVFRRYLFSPLAAILGRRDKTGDDQDGADIESGL